MNQYICGAIADIGVERENQEDFIQFAELDDDNLLCIIADGSGSRKEHPQPAPIVVMDIVENISEMFESRKDLFLADPEYFLKKAMMGANKLLGAFKMGNEELYMGYAASVTCCLFSSNNRIFVAHSGNTRFYIIRDGRLRQLTKDHTKAAELLNDGKIDEETYHVHPDRLKLTSGLGYVLDPRIDTFSGKMKDNDLALMTTDGIHYAIRPDSMAEIILNLSDCSEAVSGLVNAAKNVVKYPDNMAAILVVSSKMASMQSRN